MASPNNGVYTVVANICGLQSGAHNAGGGPMMGVRLLVRLRVLFSDSSRMVIDLHKTTLLSGQPKGGYDQCTKTMAVVIDICNGSW